MFIPLKIDKNCINRYWSIPIWQFYGVYRYVEYTPFELFEEYTPFVSLCQLISVVRTHQAWKWCGIFFWVVHVFTHPCLGKFEIPVVEPTRTHWLNKKWRSAELLNLGTAFRPIPNRASQQRLMLCQILELLSYPFCCWYPGDSRCFTNHCWYYSHYTPWRWWFGGPKPCPQRWMFTDQQNANAKWLCRSESETNRHTSLFWWWNPHILLISWPKYLKFFWSLPVSDRSESWWVPPKFMDGSITILEWPFIHLPDATGFHQTMIFDESAPGEHFPSRLGTVLPSGASNIDADVGAR